MAPVVRELGTLPAADLRAMAVYLASLGAPVTEEEAAATARAAVDASVAIAATILLVAALVVRVGRARASVSSSTHS